ncbi:MAG: sugar transferase [Chlamydiota bacterium]
MAVSSVKTVKLRRRSYYPFFKRCFDIVFSLSVLTLLSPLYLFFALVIKWDSKGPIFYKGKRLGKEGKIITIYKFRTMHLDADTQLSDILSRNPKIKAEWTTYQKIKSDPRCTRIGKLLRQTSLDELPQFFCVLKGDLSVVGPRPHYISELKDNPTSPLKYHAATVLSVKPGITSIWQVSGRSQLPYQERVALDCSYVKKQSFLYDLYLIAKTIPTLFLSKGAF